MACLNAYGNKPSESDRFRMLVIGTIRISIHSVNNSAGHGSSEHDLHGVDLIIFKTDSSKTGVTGKESGFRVMMQIIITP